MNAEDRHARGPHAAEGGVLEGARVEFPDGQ